MTNDFRNYAVKHLGMNGLALDQYAQFTSSYLSPTIMEERQLNVTQMDVFSRLMMDRVIFLGTPIDDYTSNVIEAQLLYLDAADPGKDISIYFNTPGGSVYAGRLHLLGDGDLRHDELHQMRRVDHLHRYGRFDGCRAAGSRYQGETLCPETLAGDDSPADGWRPGSGLGY